eukprot:7352966-Pyramimonas_sp.AAC.1
MRIYPSFLCPIGAAEGGPASWRAADGRAGDGGERREGCQLSERPAGGRVPPQRLQGGGGGGGGARVRCVTAPGYIDLMGEGLILGGD